MKIELDKITLGHSELSDNFYVGTTRGNKWINKKDITNQFIGCVISRWNGFKQTITDDLGNTYEVSVKKLTAKNNIKPTTQ